MSLTRMARELDMRTIVVDGRERYATRERFPDATRFVVGMPSEIVASITPDRSQWRSSSSRTTTSTSCRCCARCCDRPLGTSECSEAESEATRCARCSREEGFTDDELARIHTPIGLDIGGKSPPEVALSILGELVAVRSGKRA